MDPQWICGPLGSLPTFCWEDIRRSTMTTRWENSEMICFKCCIYYFIYYFFTYIFICLFKIIIYIRIFLLFLRTNFSRRSKLAVTNSIQSIGMLSLMTPKTSSLNCSLSVSQLKYNFLYKCINIPYNNSYTYD